MRTRTIAAGIVLGVALAAVSASTNARPETPPGYFPAPVCLFDDGSLPPGVATDVAVCVWPAATAGNGEGMPFIATHYDMDGDADAIDYTWDGVSQVWITNR